MARIPRRFLVSPGSVNHCTWRSHNFTHCLGTTAAKARFLALLADHKEAYGIEIYSYALMDTHPHVHCRSVKGQAAFSRFWQIVNYRFARWYNRVTSSRGQVVMDRLSSGRIQDTAHQLSVMRYGDLNAVRAGRVRSAKDWRWSSYRHYAFGERDPLVTDCPAYLALGRTGPERRKAYIHLFAAHPDDDFVSRQPHLVTAPFIGDIDWATTMLSCAQARAPG